MIIVAILIRIDWSCGDMRKNFAIPTGLVIAMLMATMVMVILPQAAGTTGTTTRAIEPDDEFVDIWDWTLPNGAYPGEIIDFSVRFDENYADEAWEDDYDTAFPGGTSGYLHDMRMTITSNAPIEAIDLTPDYSQFNPVDTPVAQQYGENLTGTGAWWSADVDGNDFSFRVNVVDVLVGDYQFFFDLTYNIHTGYNWANESPILYNEFNWTTHTEREELDFEVYSAINLDLDMEVMDFTSTSSGDNNIYAGAKNQKIAFRGWSDGGPVNELRNVTFKMTIPNSGDTAGITLANQVPVKENAFIKTLYSGSQRFYWYVNVANHVSPGIKEGAYLTLIYEREVDTDDDGNYDSWTVVTETMDYEFDFIIDFTPLLDVPEHNEGRNWLIEVDQNELATMGRQLPVEFTNNGNVDLKDITVWLTLSQSYYFDEEEFYNYESSSTTYRPFQLDEMLPDLAIGESAVANFDMNFFRHTPPGRYAIRVDYEVTYFDDGSTGNPTQMVKAYDNIYDDIKDDMGFDHFFYDAPYVVVNITDKDGMDFFGYASNNYYNPGLKGTEMRIYLVNQELYGISDITITMNGNGYLTDPVNGNDTAIPITMSVDGNNEVPYTDSNTPGYTYNYGGTYWTYDYREYYFLVDIEDDITDDYGMVYVTIEGFDIYHNPISVEVPVFIAFRNSEPSLLVTQAFTPNNLHPGKDFTYTVTITNVGDSEATNVEFLLRDNQDILEVYNPKQTVSSIAKGENVTLTFNCRLTDKALNTVNLGDRYAVYISWGLTTEQNYKYPLGTYSNTLYLRTSPIEQVEPVQEVKPTFSEDQSQVLSYAIFAVAIIIAAIVILFGLGRMATNINKWRYEDAERKKTGQEPPAEEEPEVEKPKKEKPPKGEPPEPEDEEPEEEPPEPPEDEPEEEE